MHKTLFLIGRPIGNLEDITIHALKILKDSEVILTESLRSLTTLLNYHKIDYNLKNIMIYDEKKVKFEDIKKTLLEHNIISYVSDAGLPVFMDPGSQLIQFANDYSYNIKVVPGISALSIALVYAGINEPFYFAGFPPRENYLRSKFLKSLNHFNVIILYESPHRNKKLLEELKQHLHNDWEIHIFVNLTSSNEMILKSHIKDIKTIINKIEKLPAVFILKKLKSKLENK